MTVGTVKIQSGENPKYFTFGASNALNTTTTQASNPAAKTAVFSTFQAIVTGTGAVTATVSIQITNDDDGTSPINWCSTALGTITLTGTTSASDGFATMAAWRYVRANVTAITGTGATLEVLMGN
jgi:hypothetical protein